MDQQKINFLQTDFCALLLTAEAGKKGKWGVMNAQQMVEHFSNSVKIASGKLQFLPLHGGERLQKMRAFLFSEKPFQENTKNPYMAEQPDPLRWSTMQAAVDELKDELFYFFDVFRNNPSLVTRNPFFGELDFNGNIQLLYKHAQHHLRQFDL